MANKLRIYGDEVIQKIIYLYIEANNVNGEIEYSGVRDFALDLWNKKDPLFTEEMYYQLVDRATGETSEKIYRNIKLSDDFWRKPQYQGRQKIDAINALLSKTAAKPKKRQTYIPNVDFLIETNKGNLAQLKLQLKPLEEQVRSSYALIDKLERKIAELEEQITSIKNDKASLKKQNDDLQDALHKFFELSAASDVPLKNQLNTGTGRMNQVEAALRTAFSGDPSAFYHRFEERRSKITNGKSNVAEIKEMIDKKSLKPMSSDYGESYDFE